MSKGREGEDRGGEGEGREGRKGNAGREGRGWKGGKERKGINLPHGRLKDLGSTEIQLTVYSLLVLHM